MKKNNSTVSIVIVNWNKKNDVLKLLDSLDKIEYPKTEIIVVDNASEDDSVEAIKTKLPEAYIIENDENLGGTGGFNTGLRHILNKSEISEYVWLLDNDAEVEKETLSELVSEMDRDPVIGIAGSRIMSPENRKLVVEAGGFIDWYAGTWVPNLRYINEDEYKGPNVVEVDYVAVCSAMLRTSAIKETGLMDERFFLHWDDIDYCLELKNHGYRVVSVFSSKVYHSVEKGFNPLILYYDTRNCLLAISKHLSGWRQILATLNIVRLCSKLSVYFRLENKQFWSNLVLYALYDFLRDNYGQSKINPASGVMTDDTGDNKISIEQLENTEKIILFANGTFNEINSALNKLKEIKHDELDLDMLVQKTRKPLMNELPVRKFIEYGLYEDSNLSHFYRFLKILFGDYDMCVSTSPNYNFPFVYCCKNHVVYNSNKNEFNVSDKNIFGIWKVFLSFTIGEILGIFLFLLFFLKNIYTKLFLRA